MGIGRKAIDQRTPCRIFLATPLSSSLCTYTVEMTGDVFFNPIPSRSQLFIPIPAPRLNQVLFLFLSQSHRLFPFHPAANAIIITISSHLLPFFMDFMKQMTSKITMNESLLVSKTTENQVKIHMSKLGHFSVISLFLTTAYYVG